MKFNGRKWFHFKGNKSIAIEWAGFKSNPGFYFRADGDEGDITFNVSFIVAIYITFEGFIPNSWYPTYESTYYPGTKLGDEREFSVSWHHGSLWWDFWTSEEKMTWTKNKSWRKGCWHIVDWVRGKHKYQRQEMSRNQFYLPFFEGIYNVEVIESERTDSYQRWFTKRSTAWEVRAGYYNEKGEFIEKPIPVEGKGENSWDCDEDATYSSSFPGQPYNKNVKTPYQAALYFWNSMMKDRERRGGSKWIPKQFKQQQLNIIR